MAVEGDVVIKEASDEADVERLGHEGRVLQTVAHPGVVRLVESPAPGRLVLHRVTGASLASRPIQPAEAVRQWAAAAATTLGDLHHLGCFHGNLRPEHVLLDEAGRPVLCGFGSARLAADRTAAAALAQRDVADLAALVLGCLGPAAPLDLTSGLRRAVERPNGDPLTGARRLARLLAEPESLRRPRKLRRGTGTAAGAAAVVLAAIAAVLALTVVSRGHPDSSPLRQVTGVAGPGGGAYVVLGTGPRATASGPWGCGPVRPVTLDRRSGQVWEFPAWPAPGGELAGRLIALVPGAIGLAATPVTKGAGCARLVVERRHQPAVVVSAQTGEPNR